MNRQHCLFLTDVTYPLDNAGPFLPTAFTCGGCKNEGQHVEEIMAPTPYLLLCNTRSDITGVYITSIRHPLGLFPRLICNTLIRPQQRVTGTDPSQGFTPSGESQILAKAQPPVVLSCSRGPLCSPTDDEMAFSSFSVVGAGNIGSFIVRELLRLKAIGTVSSVTVVSRSVRVPRILSATSVSLIYTRGTQGCTHISPRMGHTRCQIRHH